MHSFIGSTIEKKFRHFSSGGLCWPTLLIKYLDVKILANKFDEFSLVRKILQILFISRSRL